MVDNYIMNGDFCTIVTKDFEETGLSEGSYVFIAGHKALPISEEDPYTQRIFFLCNLSSPEGILDLSKGWLLVDPSSLKKVDEEKQGAMIGNLEDQVQKSQLSQVETVSDSIN